MSRRVLNMTSNVQKIQNWQRYQLLSSGERMTKGHQTLCFPIGQGLTIQLPHWLKVSTHPSHVRCQGREGKENFIIGSTRSLRYIKFPCHCPGQLTVPNKSCLTLKSGWNWNCPAVVARQTRICIKIVKWPLDVGWRGAVTLTLTLCWLSLRAICDH